MLAAACWLVHETDKQGHTCVVLQLLGQGCAAQQSLQIVGLQASAILRLLQQSLLLQVAGHLLRC